MERTFHGFPKLPQPSQASRQPHSVTTDEDTNWVGDPLSDPPSLPDSKHFKKEEQTKINSFYTAVKAFFLLDAHQLNLPQDLITKLILCDERSFSDILESAGGGDIRTFDTYKRQYRHSLIKSSHTLHGCPRGLLNVEITTEPDGTDTTLIASAISPDTSFFQVSKGTVELHDVRMSSIEWDLFEAQDTTIKNSTLKDVRFDDATFNGVRFQKEISQGTYNIMGNVTLTNVGFRNVKFEGVVLKNVHLTDAHFENVTFRNFTLENVSWNNIALNGVDFLNVQYKWSMWTRIRLEAVHLQNWRTQYQTTARVTVENKILAQEPANDLVGAQDTRRIASEGTALSATSSPETPTDPSTTTSAATSLSSASVHPGPPRVKPQALRPLPSLEALTSSNGRSITNTAADNSTRRQVTPATKNSSLFDFPVPIRKRIYKLLIPPVSLLIGDYAAASIPANRRRTHYLVRKSHMTRFATTYFVKPLGHDPPKLHLGILATCRTIHREASPIFWSSRLEFCGSPEGGLAFLHDITLQLHNLKSVGLNYRLKAKEVAYRCRELFKTAVYPTNLGHWRRFLNILVHYCPNIETSQLTVDEAIWDYAPWNRGAKEVFRMPDGVDRGYDENADSDRRALEHAARFHGPKTRFSLVIKGADTAGREQKVEELEQIMIDQMKDRPFYDRRRVCHCPKAYLDRSPLYLDDCCISKWRSNN